ncbi:MAG: response regulator [Bryobacteraceae bacterium]
MKTPTPSSVVPASQILLIDDNRNGLLVRRKILEDAGFCVSTASEPQEGLRRFSEDRFDLVITDYKMPHMTGVEVINLVRLHRPETPIILISGMVDALGLNEQNTGADVVVSKNANEVTHLVRAARRLLDPNFRRKSVASQTNSRSARAKTV